MAFVIRNGHKNSFLEWIELADMRMLPDDKGGRSASVALLGLWKHPKHRNETYGVSKA